MPDVCSASTVHRQPPIFPTALALRGAPRRPDWAKIEDGMAHALDAIRHYAGLAWWDGSAVGLHLHGFAGLFGFVEPDLFATRPEDRR